MLKEENYILVREDLDTFVQDWYTKYDIIDMLEISYILGKTDKMEQFNEILEISYDGIDSYALFVKFFYDRYCNEGSNDDLTDYINKNIDIVFKEFKEKYYI